VVLELKNKNLAMVELGQCCPGCVYVRAHLQGLSVFVRLTTDCLSHSKAVRETVLYAGERESLC